MKVEEFRKKSEKELTKLLNKKRRELTNLNLKDSAGQLRDNSQIEKNKRDIARILTIINEKNHE